MECTQVWGYDDLVEFQATQQDLSSQIGRTPALSFCPTCGIFLLDTGDTQAQRDAHIQSCRNTDDPEAFEVVSEGEDSDDATDDTSSISGTSKADKKHRTDTDKAHQACNQENSLAPVSAEMQQATTPPPGTFQPQLAPQGTTTGILTEVTSPAASERLEQKHGGQVRDYHKALHWQSPTLAVHLSSLC